MLYPKIKLSFQMLAAGPPGGDLVQSRCVLALLLSCGFSLRVCGQREGSPPRLASRCGDVAGSVNIFSLVPETTT